MKTNERKPGQLSGKELFLIQIPVTLAGAYLVSTSGDSQTAPKEVPAIVSNSPLDGSVHQVERWFKQNLNDPASFQAVEWSKVAPRDDGFVVRVKYRANNRIGQPTLESRLFTLDAAGNVLDVRE